uniref:Uncharacterized protein n=1 Tax=Oryza glumipatula TaxID=40148 RepID=A0A0D9ZAH2_9ORYZ
MTVASVAPIAVMLGDGSGQGGGALGGSGSSNTQRRSSRFHVAYIALFECPEKEEDVEGEKADVAIAHRLYLPTRLPPSRLDLAALKLVEVKEGVSARIWRRAMALAHPPLSRPRQSTAC